MRASADDDKLQELLLSAAAAAAAVAVLVLLPPPRLLLLLLLLLVPGGSQGGRRGVPGGPTGVPGPPWYSDDSSVASKHPAVSLFQWQASIQALRPQRETCTVSLVATQWLLLVSMLHFSAPTAWAICAARSPLPAFNACTIRIAAEALRMHD